LGRRNSLACRLLGGKGGKNWDRQECFIACTYGRRGRRSRKIKSFKTELVRHMPPKKKIWGGEEIRHTRKSKFTAPKRKKRKKGGRTAAQKSNSSLSPHQFGTAVGKTDGIIPRSEKPENTKPTKSKIEEDENRERTKSSKRKGKTIQIRFSKKQIKNNSK